MDDFEEYLESKRNRLEGAWAKTRDPEQRKVLDGQLATIKAILARYRSGKTRASKREASPKFHKYTTAS